MLEKGESDMTTGNEFEYPYDEVYDYYVIEAWRRLEQTPPAYTPQMVRRHTELLLKQPCAAPAPSADERGVIGMTAGWPANPDYPEDDRIPAQKIYGYCITDQANEEPEIKVLLTCGQHATEFTGSWVLEGMVNFLAGSDQRAVFLRQNAAFYVYPDMNPDGRYQAVNNLEMKAAPDPNAGTNMRLRGNPEIYVVAL